MKTKMITLGAVLLLSGSIVFGNGSTAMAADAIKVQLDWIIEGKHVPFYVARDRGFFKKNNLEVALLEGKGSANSATFVDVGQADYSYGDLLTAIQVMSKGAKNRAIGSGMAFNGGGLVFLGNSGIQSPQKLGGKR